MNLEHIKEYFQSPVGQNILLTLGVVLGLLWSATMIQRFITRKKDDENSAQGNSRDSKVAVRYLTAIILFISLILIWLENLAPLLTFFGIIAVGLTVVSKEFILNFIGSFVIFWREIFTIGDRVQIGDFRGDVIDKGIFFFTLLETGSAESTGHSTGRLVKVPNAMVLTNPVINSTRGAGYSWNELSYILTPESDWQQAVTILEEIAENHQKWEHVRHTVIKQKMKRQHIHYGALTPKVYVGTTEHGLELRLRFICPSRRFREGQDYVTTRFLRKVAKVEGIALLFR